LLKIYSIIKLLIILIQVCPEGSADYIECSAPFYHVKNNHDASCSVTLQFYIIVFGSIFAFLILVLAAFLKIRHDKKKKNSLLAQISDGDRRLMSETKDPLYHGY
jgi:hypothetical protein